MAKKNKGGRPTGKTTTEEHDRHATILQVNIDKLIKKYSSGRKEFYLQYLYGLEVDKYKIDGNESAEDALRKKMERIVNDGQQPLYEDLLMISELAGVSINELLTTEQDFDDCPDNLRDILVTLFNLLDRMHIKVTSSKTGRQFGLYTEIKYPFEDYQDYVYGHIINEFIREYVNHKGTPDYEDWRKRILKGAFAYTRDGHNIQERKPLPEIKQIVENAMESRRKVRDEWLTEHCFCGHTKEEWDAMTEEERQEAYRKCEEARLEAEHKYRTK